jgi:hypothetical protein
LPQGAAASWRWSDVFAAYITAAVVCFVLGTIADLSRGVSARRIPFTLVATVMLMVKLDDLTSHAYDIR